MVHAASHIHLKQYERLEEFEQYLGNELDDRCTLGFKQVIELDEQELYPEQACEQIDSWGFHLHYIPQQYGGNFHSFDHLFALLRLLARRDVTVVVAHAKTYLGSVGVWLNGSEQQKERLGQIIRDHQQVALALTEKEHGADVLANEVTATKVDGGYLLSGQKWLINNATRCSALTLFARTDSSAGPRSFSLFFLEKHLLDTSTFSLLPKIKTHGVRGADISGISFDNCFIPDSALIGSHGSALEATLKGFQITRTLVPAISLGAGDTALRTTMRFALHRKLYSGTLFSIPEAQRSLVDAFLRLLICESVAVSAARSLHSATGQMSLWSAVTKYFVPTQIDQVITNLAVVLGARHFLRQDHDAGIFQKLLRDSSLASLFDGSTVINLNAIAQQLQQIWQDRFKNRARSQDEMVSNLKNIFHLREPLPDFDSNRLELTTHGHDDITQSLPFLPLSSLREMTAISPQTRNDILGLIEELIQEFNKQKQAINNLPRHPGNTLGQSTELFDLARRHCVLHAAASCLWMWLTNREWLAGFFAQGEWLVLALNHLLTNLQPWRWAFFNYCYENVGQHLLRLHKEDRLFSIFPIQLAHSENIK